MSLVPTLLEEVLDGMPTGTMGDKAITDDEA